MVQRRGLFGGFNPLRFSEQPNDKMMMLGAAMASMGNGGDPSAMFGVSKMIQQRQAQAQRSEAEQDLHRGLFGGRRTEQQLDLGALASGDLGMTDTEMSQQAPPRQGLPSLRDAAPMLLQAQRAGLDIKDYITLLDKAGPDMAVENGVAYDRRNIQAGQRLGVNLSNVNGHMIDTQDPGNANRFVPQVGEGQRLLYDSQGNPVIQNIDGYTQAIGGRERAVSDARNASTASYAGVTAEASAAGQGRGAAPYALETITGPDGSPITTSRAQILQGGPIYGQSPAEQAYAVDSAKNQAEQEDRREERASAAVRMLPTLDRMEQLLPEVIAGVGADWRQTGARVLGSLGNREAAARASATEVFQNEARQVVAQIIGTFGANPTEGERKYAEQMAGADVNLTPQALAEGIRLARARAYRDIGRQPPTQQSRGARRINSRAEYDALPRGSTFIAPDGSTRRKP